MDFTEKICSSPMQATNPDNTVTAAEGLDELLDSCLDDFNRPLPKPALTNPEASTSVSSKTVLKDPNCDVKLPEGLKWREESKQFQDVMENFLENEGEIDVLNNLMSNLNENSSNDLDQTFLHAVKDLTEGFQNIPIMNTDMLEDMLKNLVQPDTDQLPEIMPLMPNVMQRLMSKELLHPLLKGIVEKYPNWLDVNPLSLKPQEYERHDQQFKLVKSVCDEFVKECDETEEAKKARFENVLALMQKIQNCGNPPKEVTAGLEHSALLDEHDNLQIPGMPQHCSIM